MSNMGLDTFTYPNFATIIQALTSLTRSLLAVHRGQNSLRSTISSTSIAIISKLSPPQGALTYISSGKHLILIVSLKLKAFHRSGTVEARIRQLVMKLEYVDSLVLAHPFIKGFDQITYTLSDEEVGAVAQGDISDTIAKRKPEDIEGKEGAGCVYSTTFYIGLAIEPKQRAYSFLIFVFDSLPNVFGSAGSVGPRRLDISYPTTEFTKQVKMWEKFDPATMGLVVRHIRRYVGRISSLARVRRNTPQLGST